MTVEDLRQIMSGRHTIGLTLRYAGDVVGFLIMTSKRNSRRINRIVIQSQYQKLGLGRWLIHRATEVGLRRREYVYAYVCERDIRSQLFFRAIGFEAEPAGEKILFKRKTKKNKPR